MTQQTHTLVVRYPEGLYPGYSKNTQIHGGQLVAVDFDGNRLAVEQELLEALTALKESASAFAGEQSADARGSAHGLNLSYALSLANTALDQAKQSSRGEFQA